MSDEKTAPSGHRDPSCITDQQTIVSTVLDHPSSPRTPISSKFSFAFKELKNPYQFKNGWKFACQWFLWLNCKSTRLKIRLNTQQNLRLNARLDTGVSASLQATFVCLHDYPEHCIKKRLYREVDLVIVQLIYRRSYKQDIYIYVLSHYKIRINNFCPSYNVKLRKCCS